MKSKIARACIILFAAGAAAVAPSANLRSVHAVTWANLTPLQRRLLSGVAQVQLDPNLALRQRALSHYSRFGSPCSVYYGTNVKVNQNCLSISNHQGAAQTENETAVAVDPNNSGNVAAGYNDFRRGDTTCGGSYSASRAQTWSDSTFPDGYTNGAFGSRVEYWQASGDPSVAFDTRGNAYYGCLFFDRGPGVTSNPDQSNGIYVFRSTGDSGASWNFPGRPVIETSTTASVPFHDKPYVTVDDHTGSPFRDRIYVTWTDFAADGTANIYGSHSDNYGESFSSPVLVSRSSSLCPASVKGARNCDSNQSSQPFTGKDGMLYVVYDNYNTAPPVTDNNEYQVLLSKSTDGGLSFSAPVLVAPFNDLPDCAAYQGGQDAGYPCVPEKDSSQNSVFRATSYPAGAVDPTNVHRVVVTFASYISRDSNPRNGCVPTGFSPYFNPLYKGVKVAGACNNKILESVSSNGGATFTGGAVTDPATLPVISDAASQSRTDQFWQWAAFSPGGTLAVSYYDRQYGSDEVSGSSDITLSGSRNLNTFASTRVTARSMPLPTQSPDPLSSTIFMGDYSGLAAPGNAIPVWTDTRALDLFLCPGTGTAAVPPVLCTAEESNGIVANQQDISSANIPIPTP